MHGVQTRITMLMLIGAVLIATVIASPIANAARGHDAVSLTGTHDRQQFSAGARVRVHDARLTDLFAAGGGLRHKLCCDRRSHPVPAF